MLSNQKWIHFLGLAKIRLKWYSNDYEFKETSSMEPRDQKKDWLSEQNKISFSC